MRGVGNYEGGEVDHLRLGEARVGITTAAAAAAAVSIINQPGPV
jgi:hypothetical protein